jgi:plastocyanin
MIIEWRRIRRRGGNYIASLICVAVLPAFGATLTVSVNDLAGIPVVDAVVSAVAKPGTRVPPRAPRQVAIEQKGREFVPYVTVVQTGTQVNFPNRDPLLHHVYSFSPAKSFEIKLYSGESPRGVLFDRPGLVTLGCNIHDWMIGYIQIVDTPYYGKTGTDGRAVISDIVAGEFEVDVWHPTQRTAIGAKTFKVEGREAAAMTVALDVAPQKKRFKPPLDAVKYK